METPPDDEFNFVAFGSDRQQCETASEDFHTRLKEAFEAIDQLGDISLDLTLAGRPMRLVWEGPCYKKNMLCFACDEL